ncbi:MAG: hypothetical protein HYR67_15275 [Bacteroidetes bacterium]|nr:hypothetical protein [Bacteroidota bacterium]
MDQKIEYVITILLRLVVPFAGGIWIFKRFILRKNESALKERIYLKPLQFFNKYGLLALPAGSVSSFGKSVQMRGHWRSIFFKTRSPRLMLLQPAAAEADVS